MTLKSFFDKEITEHEAVMRITRETLAEQFEALCVVAENTLKNGKKIIFVGNGGSAADAQHLAAELVVRYKRDREPFSAIALTTDTSALTAGSNDFGFERVFEIQLRALGNKGDLLIAITTSGRSPNVLNALKAAKEMGITAAALSGQNGGELVGLSKPLILVPSNNTARIQEAHIVLGHMMCDVLEQRCAK